MIIDNEKDLRKKILKLVPFPTNEEVVLYDKRFVNLLNYDVNKLYKEYYQKYNKVAQECLSLQHKQKEYEDFISNAKIYNKKMSEKDYIEKIQELEIIYTKKFSSIKNLEKKISVYSNKIAQQNKLIEEEQIKMKQKLEREKSSILKQLQKNDIRIAELKSYINFFEDYKKEYDFIKKVLQEEQDFEMGIYNMYLNKSNFKCPQCGRMYFPHITTLTKTIDTLAEKIKKLDQKYLEYESKKNEYSKEFSKISQETQNLKQYLENSELMYIKKNKNILQYEAVKFVAFEQLDKLQEELKSKKETTGKEYQNLKNNIDVYKTSFNNLQEIKRVSKELAEINNQIKELSEKMSSIKPKLELILDFLDMRNKVYEKSLKTLFDDKISIKLFKREDLKIISMCEVKYNNINTSLLTQEQIEEANKLIVKKLKTLE